ncbi:hypothetical protein ACOMHN_041342 [Nucella lapillus]
MSKTSPRRVCVGRGVAVILGAALLVFLIINPVRGHDDDDDDDDDDSKEYFGNPNSGQSGSSSATSQILRELCAMLKETDPVLFMQMCLDGSG